MISYLKNPLVNRRKIISEICKKKKKLRSSDSAHHSECLKDLA